jgi:D-3-phosphoglycerate dehydrogenase / 2-oxoglutarate reductase
LKKVKILIADEIPLKQLNIFPHSRFQIKIDFNISNKEVLKKYSDYEVIVIRSIRKIDGNYLSKCSHKIIATCSRGFDHIDIKTATEKNITIITSSEGNSVSAAEHTMGLILNIFKQICYSDALVRKNKFRNDKYQRIELSGKTIGIIGLGKVGSKVAKFAKSFGMKLLINDIDSGLMKRYKSYNFVNLKFLLKNSDIVTLHIPLNPENRNFLSKEKFELMRETSVFVNTSRGGVTDEKYLINALRKRKIRYAGLDVFENEPGINKKFSGLKNVLLTNHVAGKTVESRIKVTEEIFSQIKKYFVK